MADAGAWKLCIFARVPVVGQVKRRLAADIGDEAALAAHVHLVERALDACLDAGADGRWDTELWLAGPLDNLEVTRWQDRYRVPIREQKGADLGERMSHALTFSLVEAERAVLIGCDCPGIDRRYLIDAFVALSHCDAVIGPAEDGGYGLIGLKAPHAVLFDRMPWGSDAVLAETLSRAADEGLTIRLLDGIYDVDTAADWRRYQAERGGEAPQDNLEM
jgi:rSAM/selenodomain-associated transferase 1